jgi:hypothetical protein
VQGKDILLSFYGSRAVRGCDKLEASASLDDGASKPPAQDVRKSRIFYGHDHLAPCSPYRGKDLNEIQRTVIVNVLDGIIQQERA